MTSPTCCRDMDLVREIMLRIIAQPVAAPVEIVIEGRTEDEILYHMEIMDEAGLLHGFVDGVCFATGLSWAGHDFAEAARDDTLWNKAKARIKKTGAGVTIEIITAVLTKLIVDAAVSG